MINLIPMLMELNYHQFCGPHPAGLVSTHISAIDPVNINKVAWAVGYQDMYFNWPFNIHS